MVSLPSSFYTSFENALQTNHFFSIEKIFSELSHPVNFHEIQHPPHFIESLEQPNAVRLLLQALTSKISSLQEFATVQIKQLSAQATEILACFLIESLDVMRIVTSSEDSLFGNFNGYSTPLGDAIHQRGLTFEQGFGSELTAPYFLSQVIQPLLFHLNKHAFHLLIGIGEYAETLYPINRTTPQNIFAKQKKAPPFFGAKEIASAIFYTIEQQPKTTQFLGCFEAWSQKQFFAESLSSQEIPSFLQERFQKLSEDQRLQGKHSNLRRAISFYQYPFREEEKQNILKHLIAQCNTLPKEELVLFPKWIYFLQEPKVKELSYISRLPETVRGEENFAAYLLRRELSKSLMKYADFFLDPKTLQILGFSTSFAEHFPYDVAPNGQDIDFLVDNQIRQIFSPRKEEDFFKFDQDDFLSDLKKKEKVFFQECAKRQILREDSETIFHTPMGEAYQTLLFTCSRLGLKETFQKIRQEAPLVSTAMVWEDRAQKIWKSEASDIQTLEQIKDFLITCWKNEQFYFSDELLSQQSWQEPLFQMLKRLVQPHLKTFKNKTPETLLKEFGSLDSEKQQKIASDFFFLWKIALLLLAPTEQQHWGDLVKTTYPQVYLSYDEWWKDLILFIEKRPPTPSILEILFFYGDPIHQYWSYFIWQLYKISEKKELVRSLIASVRPREKNAYYSRNKNYPYLFAILWKAWIEQDWDLLLIAIGSCACPLVLDSTEAYLPKEERPMWSFYAPSEPTNRGVLFSEVWKKLTQHRPHQMSSLFSKLALYQDQEKLPAIVLEMLAQVNGIEMLRPHLSALISMAHSENSANAVCILRIFVQYPELLQTQKETLFSLARKNLSPYPKSRTQLMLQLLEKSALQEPQKISEVLGLFAEMLKVENPTLQLQILSAFAYLLPLQMQQVSPVGKALSLSQTQQIMQHISILPTEQQQFLKEKVQQIRVVPSSIDFKEFMEPCYSYTQKRIDFYLNNETRAIALSDGNPCTGHPQEQEDGFENLEELLQKKEVIPLLHDSKTDFSFRIVFEEKLNSQESEEWLAQVRWKLKVPSGIFVVCGGFGYIPIDAPLKPHFVRILVPPGEYTVTVYSYMTCPYGTLLFEQAKEKSGMKGSLKTWFQKTRPGVLPPQWLSNEDNEEEDDDGDDEDDYNDDENENENNDSFESWEDEEELADYERDLLENTTTPTYFVDYLIHLTRETETEISFPELDYGTLKPNIRALPELCPLGIVADVVNPPKNEDNEDKEDDDDDAEIEESEQTYSIERFEAILKNATPLPLPLEWGINEIEYFRELIYFMEFRANLALNIELPEANPELNPEWTKLLFSRVLKKENQFWVFPQETLVGRDLFIWIRRASTAIAKLPITSKLSLLFCDADPENLKFDQCYQGTLISAHQWRIEKTAPSLQTEHLKEALQLAKATKKNATLSFSSESELTEIVVAASQDMWCPLLQRDQLTISLKKEDYNLFSMSTEESLQKLAELLFRKNYGQYWGLEIPEAYSQNWARDFKLRRLWIERALFPTEVIYKSDSLIAMSAFPEKSQILSAEEIEALDSPVKSLGFVYLGDFYCEQFPSILIRGYANTEVPAYFVHYIVDTGPRSFEFYTDFQRKASWTTSNGSEFVEKPQKKSFGKKLVGENVVSLFQHHQAGLKTMKEKGYEPLPLQAELNALIRAIDQAIKRNSVF